MAKVTGLAHVGIFVGDLDRSRKFYEGVLGFKSPQQCKLVTDEETFHIAFEQNGDLTIELVHPEKTKVSGTGVVHHLAMMVDDIDGMCKKLDEKGIKFDSEEPVYGEEIGNHGARFIFFNGPDGEKIELTQLL
jgi:lactoylglutathione lyase